MLAQFFTITIVSFATIGFARGFLKEAVGLIGIFILFYIIFFYNQPIAQVFLGDAQGLKKIFFNIFFTVIAFVIISVLNSIINKYLKKMHFNLFFDHVLGIFVGTFKGLAIALFLTIPFVAGGDAIARNAEKFDIKIPDSFKPAASTVFLNIVNIMQHKFLSYTDTDIEEKVDTFFEILFKIETEEEDDKAEASHQTVATKNDYLTKKKY